MTMSSNIHDKSFQLKLNNINYHMYYHIRFSASVNT